MRKSAFAHEPTPAEYLNTTSYLASLDAIPAYTDALYDFRNPATAGPTLAYPNRAIVPLFGERRLPSYRSQLRISTQIVKKIHGIH